MFEKKSNGNKPQEEDLGVFKPAKGSSKVIIGHGVKIKGEILNADEVQIDGLADVTLNTDNLIIGSTGEAKGSLEVHNADVWGKIDGDLKVNGTLTVQEDGEVSGNVEYESVQIKLGGKIKGEIKNSEKIKNISDVSNNEIESRLDNIKGQNN